MNKYFLAGIATLGFSTLEAANPPFSAPAIVHSEQPENRILIIAENHESVAQREYFNSILPELKDQGYNTLLIEAPEALASDRGALFENLKSAPGILRQPDEAISSYKRILDTAETLDLDIHGYDVEIKWPWPTDTKPPLRPFLKRFVLKRNQLIAKKLAKYFTQNPDAKAVMLIGQLHLGVRNDPTMQHIRDALGKEADYDFPSLIRKSIGVATFAISLSGGDFGRASPHPFALQAIKENAADQWRFALTKGSHNADLFLHIPQMATNSPTQLSQNANKQAEATVGIF